MTKKVKLRQWEWDIHDEITLHFQKCKRATTIKVVHVEHNEMVNVTVYH